MTAAGSGDRSVSADIFRNAMRHLPSAVSIVTARLGSNLAGFTATSVSSFSADPPTLLVCINLGSSSFPILRAARTFAVNILGASQDDIADRFAGRLGHDRTDRYQDAKWDFAQSPRLINALVSFNCVIDDIIERHTHAIVLGQVSDVMFGDSSSALLYWHGRYERLGWTSDELSNAVGLCADTWRQGLIHRDSDRTRS